MIKINSIQQIDELVTEQLGWTITDVGWYHPKYPEYSRLPHFVSNPYWNQQLLDYLLINEQCRVTYNLYPDRTEVTIIDYLNFDKDYNKIYCIHALRAEQLTLCLAFLDYKKVNVILDKKIYNDINNL